MTSVKECVFKNCNCNEKVKLFNVEMLKKCHKVQRRLFFLLHYIKDIRRKFGGISKKNITTHHK